MKISILCPTRQRPNIFTRMVNSALGNSNGQCEILAYIDDDDSSIYPETRSDVKFMYGPSNGVGRAWNVLAKKSTGDYLMLANDDLVFRTRDWNSKIIDRIANSPYIDQMFVAWANDGARGACTFPIVPRAWIKAMGELVPEIFNFLYHDTWIHDVGKRIGNLIYMEDILIEHCHFSFKKAAYDDTYKRHRVGKANKRNEDKKMFTDSVDLRNQWAMRLREYDESNG